MILALLMAVWIRVSVVVVALFFEGGVPTVQTLLDDIVASENGLFFLLAYFAAGAGFALLVFATSVVSLPMLLDRYFGLPEVNWAGLDEGEDADRTGG